LKLKERDNREGIMGDWRVPARAVVSLEKSSLQLTLLPRPEMMLMETGDGGDEGQTEESLPLHLLLFGPRRVPPFGSVIKNSEKELEVCS